MNWEEVGAIGQVLGSVAVLISIAYLALQVRHAQSAISRSLQQSRTELTMQLMMHRAENDTFRRSLTKMNSALGAARQPFVDAAMRLPDVTEDDALAVLFEQWAWWQARTQTILNLDQLKASERAEFEKQTVALYGSRTVVRLFFETQKANLNPEAVQYIDALLAQPNSTPN